MVHSAGTYGRRNVFPAETKSRTARPDAGKSNAISTRDVHRDVCIFPGGFGAVLVDQFSAVNGSAVANK